MYIKKSSIYCMKIGIHDIIRSLILKRYHSSNKISYIVKAPNIIISYIEISNIRFITRMISISIL